jgi:hypothetical protein
VAGLVYPVWLARLVYPVWLARLVYPVWLARLVYPVWLARLVWLVWLARLVWLVWPWAAELGFSLPAGSGRPAARRPEAGPPWPFWSGLPGLA